MMASNSRMNPSGGARRAQPGHGFNLVPSVVMRPDAPTRAAVAPVEMAARGWLHCPKPAGSREAHRGPGRRYAVGASGRRIDPLPRYAKRG
jgi:hypothetical protein